MMEISREALNNSTVRPELVEGFCNRLIGMNLIHSWFDRLTTNGLNQRLPKIPQLHW